MKRLSLILVATIFFFVFLSPEKTYALDCNAVGYTNNPTDKLQANELSTSSTGYSPISTVISGPSGSFLVAPTVNDLRIDPGYAIDYFNPIMPGDYIATVYCFDLVNQLASPIGSKTVRFPSDINRPASDFWFSFTGMTFNPPSPLPANPGSVTITVTAQQRITSSHPTITSSIPITIFGYYGGNGRNTCSDLGDNRLCDSVSCTLNFTNNNVTQTTSCSVTTPPEFLGTSPNRHGPYPNGSHRFAVSTSNAAFWAWYNFGVPQTPIKSFLITEPVSPNKIKPITLTGMYFDVTQGPAGHSVIAVNSDRNGATTGTWTTIASCTDPLQTEDTYVCRGSWNPAQDGKYAIRVENWDGYNQYSSKLYYYTYDTTLPNGGPITTTPASGTTLSSQIGISIPLTDAVSGITTSGISSATIYVNSASDGSNTGKWNPLFTCNGANLTSCSTTWITGLTTKNDGSLDPAQPGTTHLIAVNILDAAGNFRQITTLYTLGSAFTCN